MTINERITAFIKLGNALREGDRKDPLLADLDELVMRIHIQNPWFSPENVKNAIAAIAESLKEEQIVEWLSVYIHKLKEERPSKKTAVIMAGNIPMVGFQDMLCVLISGNSFLGKLSSEDKLLLPMIAKILKNIEPRFADKIEFTEGKISGMDAVIATGSNNTSRYFEYYFGKYPHIIRKNRNSVAVLTGSETKEQLKALGNDIFLYFGLGCRNVSKLYVPEGYDMATFFEAIYDFNPVVNNNKYGNNYDYNKTVYLMSNTTGLLDNNFLLLKPDVGYASPIGVLFYETYADIGKLNERLRSDKEQIQCIVSNSTEINGAIAFGQAQCPGLNDYADGVDTMKFLLDL